MLISLVRHEVIFPTDDRPTFLHLAAEASRRRISFCGLIWLFSVHMLDMPLEMRLLTDFCSA